MRRLPERLLSDQFTTHMYTVSQWKIFRRSQRGILYIMHSLWYWRMGGIYLHFHIRPSMQRMFRLPSRAVHRNILHDIRGHQVYRLRGCVRLRTVRVQGLHGQPRPPVFRLQHRGLPQRPIRVDCLLHECR